MVRPPSRAELAKLLKKLSSKDRPHVARILGDSGGGRFPLLLEKRYRFSYHEGVSGSSDTEAGVRFYVSVAQRLPDGTWELDPLLEMDGSAALDQGKFSWNRAVVKDLDGDSQPELLTEYSYCGEANPGVSGGNCYRKLGIATLSKPVSLALSIILDFTPGDRDDSEESTSAEKSTYRFIQAADGHTELQVTTRYAASDGKRASRPKTTTYRYSSNERRWEELKSADGPSAISPKK